MKFPCGDCGQIVEPTDLHDITACHEHWRARAAAAEAIIALIAKLPQRFPYTDSEKERLKRAVKQARAIVAGDRSTSASTKEGT